MTRRRLVRSESVRFSPSLRFSDDGGNPQRQEEEVYDGCYPMISTPLIVPGSCGGGGSRGDGEHNYPFLALLAAALKKSLVTCSSVVVRDDVVDGDGGSPSSSMDISTPTDVRHVSHVTFDRFDGFLGLPMEFKPQLPPRVPSASVSVFGVSAESMQCSHDQRGNSVPTILLMMQKRLYAAGGLQAEGIFRINPENGQEEHVRSQLNKGIVPCGIDVHCLAALIKAWFRELPTGVLDSLTPEQVMHCNTEDDCLQLLKLLPLTEGALLDWAINLMADVVQHERYNKMNARNIAMVFAPNMTQMADPLTALIHAVQVMNFLKTLILRALRVRQDSTTEARLLSSCLVSPSYSTNPLPWDTSLESNRRADDLDCERTSFDNLPKANILDELQFDSNEKLWISKESSETERLERLFDSSTPGMHEKEGSKIECRDGYSDGEGEGEGSFYRLNLRKGVRKLCRHPVFQMSKPEKKSDRGLGILNSGGEGGAWA